MPKDFALSYKQREWQWAVERHKRAVDSIKRIEGFQKDRVSQSLDLSKHLAYWVNAKEESEKKYPQLAKIIED